MITRARRAGLSWPFIARTLSRSEDVPEGGITAAEAESLYTKYRGAKQNDTR